MQIRNVNKAALIAATAVGVFALLSGIRFYYASRQSARLPAEGPARAARELSEKPIREAGPVPIHGDKIAPTIKEKPLPLSLVGIYENDNQKVAYIENMLTSLTGEYKIGDTILGARLVQILSEEAILLKNQKRIILKLGEFYGFSGTNEWISLLAEDRYVVSRPRLNRHVMDINDIISEMVPLPHIVDGKIVGFRITRLKKDGIINTSGFEGGDVVKSINGKKLDSLKKPIHVYEYLRGFVDQESAPQIKIDFERNNKTSTFSYRILKD